MKISIIVPFLNEERYIRACIESLLAQDYDRGKYEIIFVDNGSTDAGPSIVREFSEVILLRETDGQVFTARNTGIQAASGEVFAFTDADCVVTPRWLSLIHEAILDGGATFVLGPVRFPSPRSDLLRIIETYRNDHVDFVIQKRLKMLHYGYTNNMGVRADVFERVGPFAEVPVPGDTEIIHRSFRLIPETRVDYRADMWVDHLEIVNLRILLRKIILYGEWNLFLDLPDYGEKRPSRYSGAEAYSLKKNAFNFRERLLFRYGLFLSNTCFTAGQWKERARRFLRRRKMPDVGSSSSKDTDVG